MRSKRRYSIYRGGRGTQAEAEGLREKREKQSRCKCTGNKTYYLHKNAHATIKGTRSHS